jgi:hypothetical protein
MPHLWGTKTTSKIKKFCNGFYPTTRTLTLKWTWDIYSLLENPYIPYQTRTRSWKTWDMDMTWTMLGSKVIFQINVFWSFHKDTHQKSLYTALIVENGGILMNEWISIFWKMDIHGWNICMNHKISCINYLFELSYKLYTLNTLFTL